MDLDSLRSLRIEVEEDYELRRDNRSRKGHNMKVDARLGMLMLVALCAFGCSTTSLPYDKIRLGMNCDDTVRLLGQNPVVCTEHELPMRPRPRQAVPTLPGNTEWRVWSDGNVTIILGFLDGRVIFSHVQLKNGQNERYITEVAPEYQ